MVLSKATLEHLRDEAYVCLCRETVQESLKALERNKAELASSRPPFGVLAGKKTRDAFESSLRSTDDAEAGLRDRLARAARYDTWLHRCISRDLAAYLEAVSPEYQRVSEIKRLLDEWERCVTRLLPDTLVAFAREMRGLRLAVNSPGRLDRPDAHEIALLHEISLRVEDQLDHITEIADAVNRHALEIELVEVRMPPLPQFRRNAWVHWICAVPLDQAMIDVARAEGEIRTFLNGMQPITGRIQASRVSCIQRQEDYLQQYWGQLRAHAQAHWVEEREVDEVLDTLAARYDAEIIRREREMTHNPFTAEK